VWTCCHKRCNLLPGKGYPGPSPLSTSGTVKKKIRHTALICPDTLWGKVIPYPKGLDDTSSKFATQDGVFVPVELHKIQATKTANTFDFLIAFVLENTHSDYPSGESTDDIPDKLRMHETKALWDKDEPQGPYPETGKTKGIAFSRDTTDFNSEQFPSPLETPEVSQADWAR
jgi:hypothetical protein